jgi:hypothetical protein
MISYSPGVLSGAPTTVSPTVSSSLHYDALPGGDFTDSRFGLKSEDCGSKRRTVYKAFPFSPCFFIFIIISSLFTSIDQNTTYQRASSINEYPFPTSLVSLSTRLPTKYIPRIFTSATPRPKLDAAQHVLVFLLGRSFRIFFLGFQTQPHRYRLGGQNDILGGVVKEINVAEIEVLDDLTGIPLSRHREDCREATIRVKFGLVDEQSAGSIRAQYSNIEVTLCGLAQALQLIASLLLAYVS